MRDRRKFSREENGQAYPYFVLFVRDYDGIWRVKSL